FEGLAGAAAVLIDYLSVLDAEHFPAFPTRRSSDLDGDVVAAAPVDRAAVVERAAVDESRAGAGEIERAAAADIQRTRAREGGVGGREGARLNCSRLVTSYAVFCAGNDQMIDGDAGG